MTEKEIRISTVIPVYNAEKYLVRCLDSVLHQGLENCEVICVDDGSSDGSSDILKEYKKQYSNFYFIQQENQHAGIARNVGMSHAKGKYIHFLDADDYLFPAFYPKLDQVLKEETADYIRFRNQAFDMQSNKTVENSRYSIDELPSDLWKKCVRFEEIPDFFMKIARGPWNGMVNRDFILRNKIMFNDLPCNEDRHFYVQVIYFAQSIYLCDLFGVYHQVNNKESLVGITKYHFGSNLQSYLMIDQFLEKADPYIRRKIMGGELRDLLNWYKTLDDEEASRWKGRMYGLLRGIDVLELDFDVVSYPLLGKVLDEYKLNPLDGLQEIHDESDLHELFGHGHLIYLYGAGRVAEAFLKEHSGKPWMGDISGVYVTTLEEEMKYFHGLPVVSLENKKECDDIYVVVTVSKRHQLPIYYNLRLKGYRHIILFSQDFCRELLGDTV